MKRISKIVVVLALVATFQRPTLSKAAAAELGRQTKAAFDRLRQQLAEAQRQEHEAAVRQLAAESRLLLGDRAGVPEVPDEFRPVSPDVPQLSVEEARKGFEPYLTLMQQRRWWQIGLDPTKTRHLPREVASVIDGCVAAHRAKLTGSDAALAMAKTAGDYLIWTQEQGGHGLIPFPAVRGGQGRVFEVSERFLRRAEKEGLLEKVLHNGWAIDDLGDGGLQFDNGLCGVALFELYEVTRDHRYRSAAIAATDWAMGRPVVPNWNYNSFSVYLLAKAYDIAKDVKYLEGAKKKARLGIYPGQLLDGKYKGRWADPHNARPAYHYILVRGLAAMLMAMRPDDPDRPTATRCLRLALQARNPEFASKGISNVDSAFEALLMVKSLPKDIADDLQNSQIDSALDVLERYAASGYRARRPVLSPGVWGRHLEFVVRHSDQHDTATNRP